MSRFHHQPMSTESRKAKITQEHLDEAARLRALWDSRPGKRLSQVEFGEKYEVGNQSAVGQFLRGQIPLSLKAARGFVQGLNDAGHQVSLKDISPRLHAMTDGISGQEDAGEYVDVPRTTIALSAGPGREPHFEERIGSLKFKADFLRGVGATRSSACVVDVAGRSMEPTIPDGAVILVNRANKEPRDRMIYALRIGGELFVKRLVLVNGNWVARSDNEDREQYPDMPLTGYQDVEILGRALWMGAKL